MHGTRAPRSPSYLTPTYQFFISTFRKSTEWEGNNITNKIAQLLVDRIKQAIDANETFRVVIIIPVHPDGPTEDGTTKAISHWIYTTVSRESKGFSILQVRSARASLSESARLHPLPRSIAAPRSLRSSSSTPTDSPTIPPLYTHLTFLSPRAFGREQQVQKLVADVDGKEVDDYIGFFCMQKYHFVPPQFREDGAAEALPMTSQIYVHSKLMVIDDVTAILGSANVNDRSMMGNRDSELGVVITDTELVDGIMDGQVVKVGKNMRSFRYRLWNHWLGRPMLDAGIEDPICDATYKDIVIATATVNTKALHEAFPLFPHNEWTTYQDMHDAAECQEQGVRGYPPADKAFLDANVKGHLIHFPSQFASAETLKGGGAGAANKNAIAEQFTGGVFRSSKKLQPRACAASCPSI